MAGSLLYGVYFFFVDGGYVVEAFEKFIEPNLPFSDFNTTNWQDPLPSLNDENGNAVKVFIKGRSE